MPLVAQTWRRFTVDGWTNHLLSDDFSNAVKSEKQSWQRLSQIF